MTIRVSLRLGWPRASIAVRPSDFREAFLAGRLTTRDIFQVEISNPTIYSVLLNCFHLTGESPGLPFRDPEGFLRHRDQYARGSLRTFAHSMKLNFEEFVQSPVSLGQVPLQMARYPEGSLDLIPETDLVTAVQVILGLSEGSHDGVRKVLDRLSDRVGVLRPDYLADEDVFDPNRYLVVVNLSSGGGFFGLQVLNPLLDAAIENGLVREAWNEESIGDCPDHRRLYHASSLYPVANLVSAFAPRISFWDDKLTGRTRAEAYRDVQASVARYLGRPVCEVCWQALDGPNTVRCHDCREKLGGKKFPRLL